MGFPLRGHRSTGTLWPAMALLGVILCGQGCYVTRLALYQNNLYNGRRPIDSMLSDSTTPAETRERLAWVKDILQFARAENLNTEDSYRYLVDVPGGVISYTVQACPPFALKARTWWFPFTGDVPYLGFFRREERDQQAEELRREGLDVAEGTVAGFSSLGWFEDPVYSPMLKRTRADLADLLLHELTHRTVWIRGSAEFNEQLAEFAAQELTAKYLTQRNLHTELEVYLKGQRDQERLDAWVRSLKTELETLYKSFQDAPPPDAAQKKHAVIAEWTTRKQPAFESRIGDWFAKRQWNNASILAAHLYAPDRAKFHGALRCTPRERIGDWLREWDSIITGPDKPIEQVQARCKS